MPYSIAVRNDSQARAAAESGNNISRPLGERSMICRQSCNSCSRCSACTNGAGNECIRIKPLDKGSVGEHIGREPCGTGDPQPLLGSRVDGARGAGVRRQHGGSGDRRANRLLKALAIPSQIASRRKVLGATELIRSYRYVLSRARTLLNTSGH